MEELIKKVSAKAGISGDQAKSAVSSVIEFVKGKVPMLGDQLQGLLGGEGGNPVANVTDSLKKKFGF